MNVSKEFRMLSIAFIVLGLLLGTSLSTAYAQGPGEEKPASEIGGQTLSLSGWFTIVWGDSKDGQSSITYTLTDEKGQETLLQVGKDVATKLGGVLQFNGKFVSVEGVLSTPSFSGATLDSFKGPAGVLNVISISLAPPPGSKGPALLGAPELAAPVSGSRPWVTIMCEFSDFAPNAADDRPYFLGMYGDAYPGLNHYWKELSFNTANIDGSTVAGTGWYMINTLATYNPGLCSGCTGSAGRTALFNDCTAAADADIDFSLYSGINMMFSTDFDFGWAWGGSRTATLDGVTKSWSTTWEPPWAYHDISVIAHEMGHGFGLPHSSYNRAAVYDNPWDVMSQDRYNCAAATDPTYGCIAQHTISYHKDFLAWIPGARKTTIPGPVSSTTLVLEDLAAPASANYQIAIIPIGGSATHFYTVEARRFTGYDDKLPDEAVIIHKVDTTDDIPAVLVPDGVTTDGWNVGDTFNDPINNITVRVNSATATGFEVTILNGNNPPTSDAGGPYTQECTGPTTTVALDGSGSNDPEGFTLTYAWSTNCPVGTFSDSTATPILTVDTSGGCVISCTVSLIVTDNQGLSSGSASAIITIQDTTPPIITCPADTTIECDASSDPLNTGAPSATDICKENPSIGHADSSAPGSCPQASTISRTWTATDICGNAATCVQTIQIVDTTPPVLSPQPSDVTVECDAVLPPETVTAADNCDLDVPTSFNEQRIDGSCESNYTLKRTWSATDDCGNTATYLQTITVQDTTPPLIECNASATITPRDAPIPFTATATDNCSAFSVEIINYNCVGKEGRSRMESCMVSIAGDTITVLDSGGVNDHISWMVRATDSCGNISEQLCFVDVVNPGKKK